MVAKEDASGDHLSQPSVTGARRMFFRSASWSSSRSPHQNPSGKGGGKDCSVMPNNNDGAQQSHRFLSSLNSRSLQPNGKGRLCLPPLQPLSISRRSLDEWPQPGSDDLGEWKPLPATPSENCTGGRQRLDLSSRNGHSGRIGESMKRDWVAFYRKECSRVAEHVYLGGDEVARDREILKQNGITHVLNCVGFVCADYFKGSLMYRTLWLHDSPSEDITSILYDVFDYFEDVRQGGGRVFVHCCQGVSRSTSLVIAYLMWREGRSFDDAFQHVKAARGIADPNMGFTCQLLQCQKRVHSFPLSPSSLLRMYRVAPHSLYDPLHLVPKLVTDPSPLALDSRGAFIMHIPSGMYIWIGKVCEALMERDARGAACQIVRYERAKGPITMVNEGEEPGCFWDAFSSYFPLVAKLANPGELKAGMYPVRERKVDGYDVDFEIFQSAIKRETHIPERESSWSALRQKFACDDMKDFLAAPRSFLSRVYSDSMMIVHSTSPSSIVSLSSSSSSSSSSSLS